MFGYLGGHDVDATYLSQDASDTSGPAGQRGRLSKATLSLQSYRMTLPLFRAAAA
jgi:hypothetical protein